MSDDLQERYRKAAHRYQQAASSEDYKEVLKELTTILQDTESLSPTYRRNCLLISGKCMESLGNFGEAEKILRNLLKEVEDELGDEGPGFIAGIQLSLADLLRITERGKEAIDYYTTTALYFLQNGDWQSEFNAYMAIAQLWQDLGRIDLTISSLDNAKSILERYEAIPFHQQAFFMLGHQYHNLGNVEVAIELEERALFLARRFKDAEIESQLIHNLAEFTFQSQDYRRALHYVSNRLHDARARDDLENITQYLSYLGACLTETGQSKKALETFDELEKLLLKHGQQKSVLSGMCLIGKAQVLVDMKKHQEAIPLLNEARLILNIFNSDTTLLENIQNRVERETKGPLYIDCPHRVLQMALTGSSQNISHSNPQPAINITNIPFISLELTDEEQVRFGELHKELKKEIYQTKYADSQIEGKPDSMIMPMKIEYVDDVEKFEIKWATYKRELESLKQRSLLLQEWNKIKNKFKYSDGATYASDSDILELLEYLRSLADIAILFAELNDRDSVRSITLHTADFVEMHTNDPMISAMIWSIRAKLLFSAYLVSEPGCLDLIEIELWRCLKQTHNLFDMLDQQSRIATLELDIKTWFDIASKILGRKGFEGLVDLIGDLYDSLSLETQFCYGIGVGESGKPARAVRILDGVIKRMRADYPGIPILLPPEYRRGLATNRFNAQCANYDAAIGHFGPYAQYIHQEVSSWSPNIFPIDIVKADAFLPRPPALAFIDNNLVVIDERLTGMHYVSTMIHEIMHLSSQRGQAFETEDGEWLQVKRDVPIASAITYLYVLEAEENSKGFEYTKKIHELITLGQNQVEKDPEALHRYINNMLRYFDDLYTRETYASYPCAAILLGMAFGLLGSKEKEVIRSYLNHLRVMDHKSALYYGSRKATLKL